MPRPRFASLEPERRRTILQAAAEELARNGVEGASYNRIIERAGVSKGAMYYYFDGRDDLLLTTLVDALERASVEIGPPAHFDDAVGFWDSVEELYHRITRFLLREPTLGELLKSALVRPVGTGIAEAIADFIAGVQRDVEELLARGRALGAVRDDLPADLLVRLVMATGEAGDRWGLENWQTLSPQEIEGYAADLFDVHVRIAAPLELLLQRQTARGTSS